MLSARAAWPVLALLVAALAALGAAGAAGSQRRGAATRSAAARPACFGAAARDPRRRCATPRLNRMVVPTPREARKLPNRPCTRFDPLEDMNVCSFGAEPGRATATVALVGDSHAGHWRGALDVVARRKGWRGLSIAHSSCPLSKAVRDLPDPARFRACVRWKRAVFAWFGDHPEVRTVFVSGLSGGTGVLPRGGRGRFETSVRGYVAAWRALPASVERIVVIRDTPKMRGRVAACVERAHARHRPAGRVCAVPRRRSLDRDPLVVAAHTLSSARVRSVDLTRFFCARRSCFPVVGGALVLRDENHMTATFSSTLGPYLLEAVDRAATGTS
jgi:hypothetical protein